MCVQSQISSKRVILFSTARNLDSKYAPQLPFQYKTMSTWISTQHILLQQNTACPTWNQSLSPWEDNQSSHVGTPWNQWMVHLSRFRSLLMRGMLNSINPQHKNCRNIWTHFCSYPYSQDNFRGLYPSINHKYYLSLVRPKSDWYIPFIRIWYTKYSKIYRHTPQPRHPCTKSHQYNNHSYFPSAYIAIGINSTINISCTPPCTSSEGGLRHCSSSEGSSPSTIIT